MSGKDSRRRTPYTQWALMSLALAVPPILTACSESETTDSQQELRFPPDTDGDDLPGLAISGLQGLPAEQAISPWLASTRMFREAAYPDLPGDGAIDLAVYDDDYPVADYIDHFAQALDTCVLRQGSGSVGAMAGLHADSDNPPPPRIGGGASIVINTPSGPWFSYSRDEDAAGEPFYEAVDQLPGVLPAHATLSIPGDRFPTVSAHPLYEPEPVTRLTPERGESLDDSSRYHWVPGDTPGHVKIDLLAFDAMGEFQGFPISCWVHDDGEFSMPEGVVSAINASEHTLQARYSRVYARLDVVNGIVIMQNNEVAE
ncbi:MAG: hypothetical protein HKN42_07785 [Granulosicoccus sp.]|nr:hypothetical protein [Granulosicoccus sp.]